MTAFELMRNVPHQLARGDGDPRVDHIAYDSRRATQKSLFVALRGQQTDGHDFLSDAYGRGCRAFVVEVVPPDFSPAEGTIFRVKDTKVALAHLSEHLAGHPAERLRLLGVTGTNGKTSVVTMLHQVSERLGTPSATIGTLGIQWAGGKIETGMTTPLAPELTDAFSNLIETGVDRVFMEVSSHAIAEKRVATLSFEVGIFTNLSQDHLDYHETIEAYFLTKARLFDACLWTVVNIDDHHGRRLADQQAGRYLLTTSLEDPRADLFAHDIETDITGSRFTLTLDGKDYRVTLSMLGRIYIHNALAVIGALHAMAIPVERAVAALADLPGVPGRLERVDQSGVFVDYAHTPDALEKSLAVLRPLTAGRLFCVFGAGGDRDRGKRPLMARAAAEGADVVIITSDNPRTEDPESILDDVVEGFPLETLFERFVDREEAIGRAIVRMTPKDTLLIAGKGHETYQIIGKEKHHFDDAEVAKKYLAKGAAR